MNVIMQVIPHELQRYETVGDWYYNDVGILVIKVSKLPDERMELAVMLHEFVEAVLCKQRCIAEESVTEFDKRFEENRVPGNFDEPGDHPDAPYHNEHQFATAVEIQFADQLNLPWGEYEEAINNL